MAKILVIDDVPTNRDVITTLLGYFGHQLLQAHDGREGLKIVVSERPDLVIVDILMPTMSGYEFVSRLRHDPLVNSTPVIFYSATFLEGETRALARACGVSHILTKPSNPEEILRVVNDVLVNRSETSPAPSGELPSVVDVVQVLNNKLFQKNKELADLNARLEQIVASRTAELQKTNDQLKEQISKSPSRGMLSPAKSATCWKNNRATLAPRSPRIPTHRRYEQSPLSPALKESPARVA